MRISSPAIERKNSRSVERGAVSTSRSRRDFTKKRSEMQFPEASERVPLVERMRPTSVAAYVGQKQIVGPGTVLSYLLEKGEIPSMIFWGSPGCGKVRPAFLYSCTAFFTFAL